MCVKTESCAASLIVDIAVVLVTTMMMMLTMLVAGSLPSRVEPLRRRDAAVLLTDVLVLGRFSC